MTSVAKKACARSRAEIAVRAEVATFARLRSPGLTADVERHILPFLSAVADA